MTHTTKVLGAFLLLSLLNAHSADTYPLVSTNATWRFQKGLSEASTPDLGAWRTNDFNDLAFTDGPAPFTYGEGYTYGTQLNDMQNNYACFFLRRTFVVTNKTTVASLRLGAKIDDGFVAWINGTEVRRVNMPGVTGDPVFVTSLSSGAPSEPVPFVFYDLNTSTNYLLQGTNTIAVQVFNTTSNSTDIVFDASLDAVLVETNPPVVFSFTPAAGNVTTLTQIVVNFSEPVQGVDAGDLVVNDVAATSVSGAGTNYTFSFPQPGLYGQVHITWGANHGIGDTAIPPNAFDGSAPSAKWDYNLIDTASPTIAEIRPAPGTTVRTLAEVRVTFNENVTGVNAGDLRLNNIPATNVLSLPGSIYVFQFAPAPPGNALLSWAAGHGITDVAPAANAFAAPAPWGYSVDPNASLTDVVINEILAANATGLTDPIATNDDTDPIPWIELFNRGAGTVDLAGWSLSDDPDFPEKWIFPSKTMAPGTFLIVFASGLNITNATGTNRLHTNFKLSRKGDFVGLYSPDAPPALVSGFEYPEQRNDYSYGTDNQAQLRYFSPPTPNAPNGASTISGVVSPVHFNVSRGHFTQPFDLILSCETRGASIRYSTNGSEPTLTTGFPYIGTLRVAGTMMVRAAAFRTNMLPSRIATHSYLFNLPVAQRSLPVISIVTDQNNMTGPNGITGISNVIANADGTYVPADATGYHNPSKHGIAWERPTSVEFIRFPDNSGFQTDAGIRVQGSDYQRPRTTISSKFSFRVYFRSVYGDGRLNYPLFPLAASEEYDQIVLRAGFNEAGNPFIRDELTRRISHDMGNVASHGTLASLFVNGVYKGFYNPTERVHEEFLQSYLGGSDDWDVVGPSFATGAGVPGVIDGDRGNFTGSLVGFLNSANVNDPATYQEAARRLDLPNFVDYCLLNSYCAMGDWPQNNWRAGKDRAAYPWRFIVWDAEWAMGFGGRAVTLNMYTMGGAGPNEGGLSSTGDSEIAQIYQRLRQSPEFRLLWADRMHKHLFNGGALTEANITNRFNQLRNEMAGVFTMNTDIITSWVPQRRDILLSNTIPFGQLASSNAPVLSQFGGRVPVGFQLGMTVPVGAGTIYYTTNGSDPRVPFSGAISNAALAYSAPIALNGNLLLRARTLENGNWSALTEARFEVAVLGVPIRITELHYNPSDSPNYEFIELMNIGGAPADLSGASFEGIDFTFALGSIIQPGARIVLATSLNPTAFSNRYPGVTVYGYYGGGLNNGGERITLRDFYKNIITSAEYDDAGGWATRADGSGPSLELIDPYGDPNDPANWRASTVGGTPGATSTPPLLGAVRLNEILADNLGVVNNGGTFPDFVELANTSSGTVNISGWSLTDDGNARKFVFPPGTSLGGNGYISVWCDDTTNTTPGFHAGFALGRNGDNVYLYDANTNLVDALTFGLQLSNYSVGRIAGSWTLTVPTFNTANVAATLSSAANLSINEFLANPIAGADDWIELYNNSANAVALQGCFLATTSAVHQITSLSFVPPFGFVQLHADENPGADHLNFKLPSIGGAIALYDNTGTLLNQVTYGAQTEGVSRGRLPDGTANIVNFPGTASPGASNYAATYGGPVLNEVLARNVSAVTNAGRIADFVELFNPTGTNFPLAGMSLSVNSAQAGEWTFPPGASIAPLSYLTIWCDGGLPASTNAGAYNIGESLDGESGGIYLFNTAGQLVNSVEYGFQVADRSIGLISGAWRLLPAPTPGAFNGNTASAVGSATALRVNEWMADAVSDPDWFELFNTTNQPVDLSGLVLTDDPSTSGTNGFRIAPLSFIGANSFVQWVADGQVDQGRNHAMFSLDADGDSIRLYATNGSNVIDHVAFGAQILGISQGRWPDGVSNFVSFAGSPTPGESNYRLLPGVVINELLTHTSLQQGIELRNISGEPIDLSGWFLSNDATVAKKFRIPDGSILAANGYRSFSQAQFNSGPNAFLFDRARGGELWLSSADLAGNLTGFRTRVKFGAAESEISFGRFEISGQVEFVAQANSSLGSANGNPKVGPVVINEIMYNPTNHPAAVEFIELKNIDGAPVDLSGWRLDSAVSYTFPPGALVLSGTHLLVVDFDPIAAPALLASFRAFYAVAPGVAVYGPYSGKLDNNGESIELFKPGLPDGAFVPSVLVDKVNYRDSSPWPGGATDGGGYSLQRRTSSAYGNDPANWLGAAPTAGASNNPGAGSPPTITQSPQGTNTLVNSTLLLQAAATGTGPFAWQWRFNGNHLQDATNSSLLVEYVQLGDSGTYDVFVRNSSGPAFSAPAQVTVVEPPTILTAPPANYSTNAGSNVTFNVNLVGSQPLTLQWHFEGTPIPGANGSSLTLSNVVLNQSGVYTLTASNPYGFASTSVTFVALVLPGITNVPVAQTVAQGGTAIFSITAGPIHPLLPLTYRWLRQGVGWSTTSIPVLVITNCQPTNSGSFRCQVVNARGSVSTAGASLVVLPDFDGDGIGDQWETNYPGLSTNNVADGALDFDNDGMSNRDEFIAGTDPTNATSVLKLVLSATNANVLTFVAQPTKFYTVQSRTNLTQAPWTTVTNFVGATTIRTAAVNSVFSPQEIERYYRILTPGIP